LSAVKHESHWVIAVVALVCLLYFTGMKLSGAAKQPGANR
jgi:hypothetical protein